MGYHNNRRTAARNVREVKGFECPTCTSYVPRGYEICYHCGDDVTLGSGGGSDFYEKPTDDPMFGPFFFFWFTFIAPISYWLSNLSENPAHNPLNFLLLIPCAIMVISSVASIARQRTNLGCIAAPIRIWVLVYSALAFKNSFLYYIALF